MGELISMVLMAALMLSPALLIRGVFKKAEAKGGIKYIVGYCVPLVIFNAFAIIDSLPRDYRFRPLGDFTEPFLIMLLAVSVLFFIVGMAKGSALLKKKRLALGAAWTGGTCPVCGAEDWRPIGEPGCVRRAFVLAFTGFIGALIARSFGAAEGKPVIYQCRSCKTKWNTARIAAPAEGRLETPAEIAITRPGGFVGALVPYFVYMNGALAARLDNGKTIKLNTSQKRNLLFITDLSKGAFKDFRRFEAKPGEHLTFTFNRKFL